MIEMSPTIAKLATAMQAVQKEVSGVAKDSTNPHFRNKYASLESVVAAVRDHYLGAGLVVMQFPGPVADGVLSLTTMVAHESGEWLKSTAQIPLGKSDPQGAGSALTYIERYSLMALFNLPPVDDDAETAGPRYVPNPPARTQVMKPVEPAPPPPPPGAIVSKSTRARLLEAMAKQATRTQLNAWSDSERVREAIEGLADGDRVFFDAAFSKHWNGLPETTAMAG